MPGIAQTSPQPGSQPAARKANLPLSPSAMSLPAEEIDSSTALFYTPHTVTGLLIGAPAFAALALTEHCAVEVTLLLAQAWQLWCTIVEPSIRLALI